MTAPFTCSEQGEAGNGWFTKVPLRLLDCVTLLQGANGSPMLFHSVLGKYIRVTPSGVAVLALLDGSRTGIEVAAKLGERPGAPSALRVAVQRFLADLRQAGVLNVPPAPVRGWKRILHLLQNKPMLRLRLAGSLEWLLLPIVARLRRVPGPIIGGGIALSLIVAAFLATHALLVYGWWSGRPFWPLVIVMYLLHITVHELSHAIVCQWLGVPIREGGLGLLYYFLPVAYVDRTDAYRLKSRRDRAAIALAGPVADLLGAGGSASILLLATNPALIATAHILLIMQVTLLLCNLNPLLPTDGYQAVESAIGEINLRQRSMTYLVHRLTKQSLPSSLAYLTPWRQLLYSIYALCAAAYVAVLALGMASMIRGYVAFVMAR